MSRALVVEFRLTRQFQDRFLVRYWIESAPAHGGVSGEHDAYVLVDQAERRARDHFNGRLDIPPRELAVFLSGMIPEANSIEVTYSAGMAVGDGVALHKDWP